MYRKRHLKYNDKTWELNHPICLSQNCFLTHYLLTISININAKITSLWMIGSSIVSTSILIIYFNKVILRSVCTVTILCQKNEHFNCKKKKKKFTTCKKDLIQRSLKSTTKLYALKE